MRSVPAVNRTRHVQYVLHGAVMTYLTVFFFFFEDENLMRRFFNKSTYLKLSLARIGIMIFR